MTEAVTDPEWMNRVRILCNVSGGGTRNPISFGFWVLDKDGDTLEDWTTKTASDIDALIGATTTAGLRSLVPDETTFIGWEVSRPLVQPQPVPSRVTRSLIGAAGGLVAPQTAACFTFRSGFAGPAFRGRCYVGGIRSTLIDQTTGLLIPGNLTTALTAWATFRTAASSFGTTSFLSVLSRFTNVNGAPVPRTPPLAAPVLSITADDKADTQRRRAVR